MQLLSRFILIISFSVFNLKSTVGTTILVTQHLRSEYVYMPHYNESSTPDIYLSEYFGINTSLHVT